MGQQPWCAVLRFTALALVCAAPLVSSGCLLDERPPPTDGPVDDDGDGFAASDGDCDDRDPTVNPNADETCDGVDQDCDGEIDEDPVDPLAWWVDADEDGYGDRLSPVFACDRPAGAVPDNRDCDDSQGDVNPGVAEVCNGRDDDCDLLVDDDDPDTQYAPEYVWTPDRDGDGFGDRDAGTVSSCGVLPAHVNDRSDCDDTQPDISPDGIEVCDGVDDDCDGLIDDDDPSRRLDDAPWWFTDTDGDGLGAGDPYQACTQPAESSAITGDCDDGDPNTFPGAPELCDGIDNTCTGSSEAGTASFEDMAGNWTDQTLDLGAGTEKAPAAMRYDVPGTLHVCTGVWYAHLSFDADIIIIGNVDPGAVVLSGAERGRVITVDAADANIELTGVTLERGAADAGAAIWMEGGSLTVRESVLWFHSSTGSGGAIWHSGGTTSVSDTEIRACSAGDRGGALYLSDGELLATGLELRDHSAETSGGAVHAENTTLVFAMSEVSSNTSGTDGGALAIRDATATFDDVTLEDNVASDGSGGAIHASGVTLALAETLLEGNLAQGHGGALWASNGTVDLSDTLFESNDAAIGDGGAAVLIALTAWLSDVQLYDNTARERGGGVLLDDAVLDGSGLDWSDNAPDDLHVLSIDQSYTGTEAMSCDAGGCF
jgi:predicted outer membrane repeat protein